MRKMREAALITAALAFGAPAPGQDLKHVLTAMDRAAEGFSGMSAKLKWVTHTKVLNEDSEENGIIRIKRVKKGGLRMLIDISKPEPKAYAFAGHKFETYYPNMRTVEEYDLGKYGQLVDQFLLLGFGMPGQELAKSYDIKLLRAELIAGERAGRLELIPKSAQAREHLTKVELWISEASGQPVQQKFYQPSGDYKVATYLEVKMEPQMPDDAVRLKLPRGTKREFPQK